MMVELWMSKREMGDEDENDMENTSGPGKSGVQLARLGLEDLILVILQPGSRVVPAISGMVNWLTHENLWSPSFSWWFPSSPLISLCHVLNSTITQEHKVKSSLSMSPCHYHALILSTAYIKFSIIHGSIQIDCFHVLLQSCSIIACKSISKLAQSQAPNASLSSLNLSLELHLRPRSITASKSIATLAQSRHPSASPILLYHGLQVHLRVYSLSASKCISEHARWWPQSVSPRSLHRGLQVHLWVYSISASKCISHLPQSRPPSTSSMSDGRWREIQG